MYSRSELIQILFLGRRRISSTEVAILSMGGRGFVGGFEVVLLFGTG